ncbi:MAG TPA: GNAT family N-acetyltransferase [Burkholderiaceae bacterium]|nr:GNAT family N-acetyltransferase [Burkholderiaceae bacterium]
MSVRIVIGVWSILKEDARAVRHEVFVIEQNIPVDLEWDGHDPVCLHAVAYDEKGQPLGTGRLLPDGHIGRMAVKKPVRGTGIGGALLMALVQEAELRGDRAVMLNAQAQAAAFYVRHGFVRDGEEFMEAGIPHIAMRYAFPGAEIT